MGMWPGQLPRPCHSQGPVLGLRTHRCSFAIFDHFAQCSTFSPCAAVCNTELLLPEGAAGLSQLWSQEEGASQRNWPEKGCFLEVTTIPSVQRCKGSLVQLCESRILFSYLTPLHILSSLPRAPVPNYLSKLNPLASTSAVLCESKTFQRCEQVAQQHGPGPLEVQAPACDRR